MHIYRGHTDGVQCIQHYQDQLISGSMDKTIRVWNTKTAKTIKTFRGHQVYFVINSGRNRMSSCSKLALFLWIL